MTSRQKFQFARRKSHRSAGVDEDVSKQVDFFTEDSNIQPVGASVNAPIEIAQIVSRRVAAIVGKFQTGAAPRRGVAAGLTAEEFPSGTESQYLQPSEKFRGKRVG